MFKHLSNLSVLILLFSCSAAYAQSNGSAYYKIENEAGELTKKINVWGYVKNPGRYEVPASTNLLQLIAYAGGPRDHALMDEVKIYRNSETGNSSSREVNVENLSKTRDTDLLISDEDTIVIYHSSTVTLGEIFSFVGTPLAIVTSLILIADRLRSK